MKINDKIHGFTVTNIRNSEHGEFIEMSHEKTAARLAWLNNKEENKLFSITFKTIPGDDTGVFHILEHSVLGGSESYPVKEPFLYLMKSSMNTFLNAMTFPDKTMFPVSSRNNADFMNLARVYLDGIFRPSIYTKPDIFYQEGHHIEWFGDDEAPAYKGVVFNEMKGVYSSVHERMESEMTSLLFPDNCYRFEYGGLPEAIPELTYEQFLEAHKKFYHPSNSYIYLDGDVDITAVLRLLDEYLSAYDMSCDLPDINVQTPVASCEKEVEYEISPDEDTQDQVYLAVGKILASWNEREKITAVSVLTEALAGSNDAPLKRAVLDTGLCVDMSMSISDNIFQPFGVLKICNIERENGEKLLAAAESAVRGLVENGIGVKTLESALNRCEFRYKESEEPKGLTRCIDSMSSWLYGGDPLDYIDFDDVFESLRKKIGEGYFERLLAEWLLDENGRAVLYMLPSLTYGDEQAEKEKQQLERSLEAMTDYAKSQLAKLNNELVEWQNSPDLPEDTAKLPKLPLSEVSEEPIDYKTELSFENGVRTLLHPAKSSDIAAMNLYFSVDDLTKHELGILSVMERLIAELPTRRSSGIEMQQKITGILGGLNTDISAFGKEGESEKCSVFFVVKSRFLTRNAEAAQELICEILTETLYEDAGMIAELLKQDEEELKQDIISDGTAFALRRARASLSAESAVNEYIHGFESYKFLRSLNEDMEKNLPQVLNEIKALAVRVFCRSRLTVSVTSAEKQPLDILVSALPEGEKAKEGAMGFSLDIPAAQGIVIPAGVSYTGAALTGKITDKAAGSVLSLIVSYEYLWNEVRVKGGAYGTGFGINKAGEAAFNSYRDPSPERSLEIYGNTAEFLREYFKGEPDISSCIISEIASQEPLLSDGDYGIAADEFYFRGINYDTRKAVRRQMLDMTAEELLTVVPMLEKQCNFCVIGSKDAVNSCRRHDFKTEVIS